MAVELVTFPRVDRALVSFLNARLTTRGAPAWVSTQIPADRPTRLVRVSLAGGSRRDIATQRPFVLFECWEASETAAYALADLCLAEVEAATRSPDAIAAGVWIGGTPDDFSAPASFPDPDTRNPRFQFTANLTLTGTPL